MPDAAVLVLGVVLGVGIFRSPQVVAANTGESWLFLALWVVGGVISAMGALCYAELASAYPDAGGEYHFISRAFGRRMGFLVVWSRMTVIQTGSIAVLAYVFGDYAAAALSLGPEGPPVMAAAAVVGLTAVNVAGLRQGRWTQYVLTGGSVAGLLAVVAAGLALSGQPPPPDAAAAGGAGPASPSPGVALVFVLLAFGGWSEGAYLSAEVRSPRRKGVARSLLLAVGALTLLYLLANVAYLQGLGLEGVARTDAVAARVAERALGPWGGRLVSVAVVLAALSSANATVITGARSNYAMGRDFAGFGFMGRWRDAADTPARALWIQGGVALLLVGFGAVARGGFEAMVAYTAPVFWLVLLFTGASVLVLRRREPDRERPFRVPLYPALPLLFCAAAGYMAYSAVLNAGSGALLGLAVLAAGVPVVLYSRRSDRWGGEG